MATPRVWQGEAFEAGTKYPAARVVDALSNAVLIQSDFSGLVQRRVYDLSSTTPETAILSNTATVASVIYDTLQTWEIDSTGYNFRDGVSSNDVGEWVGGHTYRFCYLLPHLTQGYVPVVFDLYVRPLLSLG